MSQSPKPRNLSPVQSRKKQLPAGRKTPVTLLIYPKNSKIPFPRTAAIGIKSALASAVKAVYRIGTITVYFLYNPERLYYTSTRFLLTNPLCSNLMSLLASNTNEEKEALWYQAPRTTGPRTPLRSQYICALARADQTSRGGRK